MPYLAPGAYSQRVTVSSIAALLGSVKVPALIGALDDGTRTYTYTITRGGGLTDNIVEDTLQKVVSISSPILGVVGGTLTELAEDTDFQLTRSAGWWRVDWSLGGSVPDTATTYVITVQSLARMGNIRIQRGNTNRAIQRTLTKGTAMSDDVICPTTTHFLSDVGNTIQVGSTVYTKNSDYFLTSTGGNWVLRWADGQTVLLLHCNGTDGSTTFTDSSAVPGKTVTAAGAAQIDTAQYVFGGASGLFNGTTDYVSTPHAVDFDFVSGNFEVDMRFRIDTTLPTAGNRIVLFSKYQDASNYSRLSILNDTGTYKLEYHLVIATVATVTLSSALPPGFAANAWYHTALTRSGNNWNIYFSGSRLATVSVVAAHSITGPVVIGAMNGADFFNGWIDEVRISKGNARWSGTSFTLPTQEYQQQPTDATAYTATYYVPMDAVFSALSATQGPQYDVDELVPALTPNNVISWTDVGGTVHTPVLNTHFKLFKDSTGNYVEWMAAAGGDVPPASTYTTLRGVAAYRISPTLFTAAVKRGDTPEGKDLITQNTRVPHLMPGTLTVGGRIYNLGIDYELDITNGLGYIDWSTSAGNEPAARTEYTVSLSILDYTPRYYEDANVLRDDVGYLSPLGISGMLALAPNNDANRIWIAPVTAETQTAFATARDRLRSKAVDLLTPVITDDVDYVTWRTIITGVTDHAVDMSSMYKRRERYAVCGVPKGTTKDQIIELGTSYRQMRLVLVYPPSAYTTVADESGNEYDRELNGSYLAAALAGRVGSFTDPANPILAQPVVGFTGIGLNPETGAEFEDDDWNDVAGNGSITVLFWNGTNLEVRDSLTTDSTTILNQYWEVPLAGDYIDQVMRQEIELAIKGIKLLDQVLFSARMTAEKLLKWLAKDGILRAWNPDSLTVNPDPDNPAYVLVDYEYVPVFTGRVAKIRSVVKTSLNAVGVAAA